MMAIAVCVCVLLAGQGPIYATLRLLVFGDTVPQDSLAEEGQDVSKASPEPTSELSTSQYCIQLIVCTCGLQVSYLIWGILQVQLKVVT